MRAKSDVGGSGKPSSAVKLRIAINHGSMEKVKIHKSFPTPLASHSKAAKRLNGKKSFDALIVLITRYNLSVKPVKPSQQCRLGDVSIKLKQLFICKYLKQQRK